MFSEIFLFELRYRLRRPATWIYFGLFLLMAFLLMLAAGGAFPGGAISFGGNSPNVKANAPSILNWILTILSWFGVLVASALLGNPVHRDFEYRTSSLFFTAPITRWGYLGGRFLGSLVVALLVFSGLALGAWLGTVTPFTEAGKMGPNRLLAYVWPYLVFIVPNLLLVGGITFTLATLTRNILSTYLASVGLLIGYLIASSLLGDLDNELLAAALDPFGSGAIYYTTRYWTPAEQNTLLLPLSKYVVLNRALWLSLTFGLLAFCYARFRFSAFSSERVGKKVKKAAGADAAPARPGFAVALQRLTLPITRLRYDAGATWATFASLVQLEWRAIVRNVYFAAIVAAGVLFMLSFASQIGKIYDTTTYPVTGEVVGSLTGQFSLFLLIIITFYAGEAVWRDRDAGLAQITDALPVRGWIPLLSKLTALALVLALLLGVVLVLGVLIQTFKGYTHYQFDVYLTALYGIAWPRFVLMAALALVVQVVVNNKYLGHFVMVAYYLLNIFRSRLGLSHRLFGYGSGPDPDYSALNGWGHFLSGVGWLILLWSLVAGLLLVLGYVLLVRGTVSSVGERLREAARRFGPRARLTTAALTLGALAAGGWVFYNTNVLNIYRTPQTEEKLTAEYEKTYRRFRLAPQPRITAVNVRADLYPRERAARFRGMYWLVNRARRPIDSLHIVGLSENAIVRQLAPGRGAKQVLNDLLHSYRIIRLGQSLQPGDSIPMQFDVEYRERGFPNSGVGNTSLVYNGTFLNSTLLPSLGYQEAGEIQDRDDRKRLGLPPRREVAPLTDSLARRTQFISSTSDWVRFEAVVGTEADQTAIAPGYLQKEWTEGDRRYFHYRMDRPIANFFNFVSARYTQRKDSWQSPAGGPPVAITVYYQPGHEYNLDRMIKAVKASLTYYSQNFCPYPDRQVRILEFPGYSSFAQSFVNTIPYSESIGFIAKVDDKDPESVDYPYYITAHEMAHQWWGHQVMPADVEGSPALSETMSQYSALMLMKAHVGAPQMQKFLKHELNSYLIGRGFERRGERPIYKVAGQDHIYYRKGSVVMYGLADYLGEANVNAGLGEYMKAVRLQKPPYTITPEWVTAIQRHTPDSLHRFVTDGLEKIALYDNRLLDATATKQADGQWRVKLTVQAGKVYADSLGNETPASAGAYDAVPIALLPEQKSGAAPPAPLLLVKRRVKPGKNELEFVVKQKPAKAGVDPYHVLVDRTLEDNVKDVSENTGAKKTVASR